MSRSRRIDVAAVLVTACLTAPAGAWGQAPITSTFSSDVEGWTHSGAALFEQQGSGGNPDGFLYIDNSEGPITYVFAPAAFLGDLSAYDGGTFSIDANMLGIGGAGYTNPEDYGHLRVSGPGGAATADLVPGVAPDNTPPFQEWATFEVAFDAAGFGVTQPEWDALLANVSELRLSVEALFGAEIQGVDNVELAPEPTAGVGVAAAAALAACAGARRRGARSAS
jgi:hypothetical protein